MNTPPNSMPSVMLSAPIIRDGRRLETVSVRHPLAGDLVGLRLSELFACDVGSLIKALPRCTTPPLSEEEVAFLPASDLLQLANALCMYITSAAQPAGAPSHEGALQ